MKHDSFIAGVIRIAGFCIGLGSLWIGVMIVLFMSVWGINIKAILLELSLAVGGILLVIPQKKILQKKLTRMYVVMLGTIALLLFILFCLYSVEAKDYQTFFWSVGVLTIVAGNIYLCLTQKSS